LNEGFLGTAAPRYADVVVLLEIGMGVALLIGAVLARTRRFRLHAWCQSIIVLLNLVVIVLVMITQTGDDAHRRAARAQLRQIRSDDAARTFISKVREQADNAEHKNEAQGDAFCVRSR
jgi:Ca2+/H+ antiporter